MTTLAQGARQIHNLSQNIKNDVPKHSVKACATAFKHIVKPQTHRFKNFGKTGGSNVGTGVHFRIGGSGSSTVATVTTYGPFGILELGARPHIILPKAGRGQTSSGKTRTRRGAQGLVSRRLAKGKSFQSLEGGSALTQHALKIGDRFTPYAKHPGTRATHPWAKSVAVFVPVSQRIFEKSTLIGMAKTILG